MKKILSGILIIIMAVSITACGGSNKNIEEGNKYFSAKEYEKSLEYFQKALDEGYKDDDISVLCGIIDTYIKADNMFDSKEYKKADELLSSIDESYKNYSIKDDIDALIKKNNKELEYLNANDEKLSQIEKYIDDNNFTEADTLISELEKRNLSDEQKIKFEQLKEVVKENIDTIKAEEENNKNNEENKQYDDESEEQDNSYGNGGTSDNNSGGNGSSNSGSGTVSSITKDKAIQLVKNYMSENGDYIPEVVRVDNEDSSQYVIHAYDVIDNGDGTTHTATSGWYRVDKATGKVTSMF